MYTIKPLEFGIHVEGYGYRTVSTPMASYSVYLLDDMSDAPGKYCLDINDHDFLQPLIFDTQQECIDAANKHNIEQCEKMLDKVVICEYCEAPALSNNDACLHCSEAIGGDVDHDK